MSFFQKFIADENEFYGVPNYVNLQKLQQLWSGLRWTPPYTLYIIHNYKLQYKFEIAFDSECCIDVIYVYNHFSY